LTLWLKAHRVAAVLAAILAMALALTFIGDLAIPMPGLFVVHGLAVPIALLAPLTLSTAIGFGLSGGDPVTESVAVRRVALIETTFGVAAALLAGGGMALLGATGVSDLGIASGRNALGYVGLLLLAAPVVGRPAAPLIPAGLALFCAFFGGDNVGDPQWWAWMLRASDDARAMLIAMVLLFAGTVAFHSRGSPKTLGTDWR